MDKTTTTLDSFFGPSDGTESEENVLQYSSDFAEALGAGPSVPSFGITKKGYFALVSKHAKVGDHIVIFRGENVPFVLRKEASRDDLEYQLVGDCYVH